MKKPSGVGIGFILLGIAYLVLAAYVLYTSDWNPKTKSYVQYLPGQSGAYVGGISFESGTKYALVWRSDVDRIVITDIHGEVESVYRVPGRVLSFVKNNEYTLFSTVEGNAISVYKLLKDGIQPLFSYRVSRQISAFNRPYVLRDIEFYLPVDEGTKECLLHVYPFERNIMRPVAEEYCSRAYMDFVGVSSVPEEMGQIKTYILANDGVFSYVLTPKNDGIYVEKYDGNFSGSVLFTDRCPFGAVGITDDGKPAVAYFDYNALFVLNTEYSANSVVCNENRVYFDADGYSIAYVGVVEVNKVGGKPVYDAAILAHIGSSSGIIPLYAFLDPVYEVVLGSAAGSPAYVRTLPEKPTCPDSLYNKDTKLWQRYTFKAYERDVNWDVSRIVVDVNAPLPVYGDKRIDEDFSCYNN